MIRESTADIIRRRRGMPGATLDGPRETDVVRVPVPEEFQAQERASQPPVMNLDALPEPDPADVEQAAQMIEEQERHDSIPAQVGQAVTGATPVDTRDEDEIYAAQEADRKSHLTAGIELAGRQLVGGITQTPVGQGLGPAPSRVPGAMAAAKSRQEKAAAAIRLDRQHSDDARMGRMDDSTLALRDSQTERNLRPSPGKGAQVDYTGSKKRDLELRRDALVETIRRNKAQEDIANRKLNRPAGASKSSELTASQAVPGYAHDPAVKQTPTEVGKIRAMVASSKTISESIDELTKLIDTHGTETLPGEAKAQMQSLGANILAELKGEAGFELGVLAGPDMEIMREAIGDATSLSLGNILGMSDVTKIKLRQSRDSMLRKLKNRTASGGYSPVVSDNGDEKPSPGPGYVRGKVGGKPGWINAAKDDFEAD